ncbi:MAG: response regulator [Acidobacteriota bacterium]
MLVVEDDPVTLLTVKDRLRYEGFDVETAVDGEEALAKARAGEPGCIVLDVMLPKLDGFRVCRLLRFDPQCRSIPIIMLTARSQEADRSLGKATGADEYLVKPVDLGKLVREVREQISRAEVRRGLQQRNESSVLL